MISVRASRSLLRALWIAWAVFAGLSSPARGQETTAPPPAAPQTTLAKPPLPNRANDLMPAWLRVRGEFRERFEGFQGAGFVDARDDTYWLSRFRFNATVVANRALAFQVQAQDARVGDKQVGVTGAPFQGTFDLRLAFADLGSTTSRVLVRAGRQELFYGDQRLIGHVSWLNTARSFDGVKTTVRGKRAQVDVFATSVVRIMDGEFDKSGNGNRFFGAYGNTTALIPQAVVEPYVLIRQDRNVILESGGSAGLTSATVGGRLAGRAPGRLDYTVEMAAQTGSAGSDSIRAWAGHWRIRESLPGASPLRFSGEFNAASGDADPANGKRGTFDQLYPTPHDKYGLADQVGWRNLRHVRAGLELPPIRTLQVHGNYHSWWLMESRDALYAASGAAIARVPGGAASTHVGHEIDVQAARQLTPQLQVAAGYAHIIPGRFLQEATPGASYSMPYVMVTYVFLADK